jgi:DNA-directed RNA polymerase subunit RPC12/RpoP
LPQKIICEGCGEILFNGLKLRPPEEIIKELENKCPYCGKILLFNPDKVEINIIE